MLFKPSILIVVLFFLWQSKNRKQFLIFLSLGFTINYIAFLWYPGLIVPFIANLLFRYNELGLETFVGNPLSLALGCDNAFHLGFVQEKLAKPETLRK